MASKICNDVRPFSIKQNIYPVKLFSFYKNNPSQSGLINSLLTNQPLGQTMPEPGIIGAIGTMIKAGKADAESERRAKTANDTTPLEHHAPLHHLVLRQFDIQLINNTPFTLKRSDSIFTPDDSLVEFLGNFIQPGETEDFRVSNAEFSSHRNREFEGGVLWSIADGKEKMKGEMWVGITWQNKHDACGFGKHWPDEGKSSPYWNNFSITSPEPGTQRVRELVWTLHFKK